MTETTIGVRQWLNRWASEPYAYLTTVGRRTGRPHRIEIWFAVESGRIYVMSGGRDRADWVRNLLANPHVTVELGFESHHGAARVVPQGNAEDERARELLVNKYATPGNPLHEWKRRSLPVVIEFVNADNPAVRNGDLPRNDPSRT